MILVGWLRSGLSMSAAALGQQLGTQNDPEVRHTRLIDSSSFAKSLLSAGNIPA